MAKLAWYRAGCSPLRSCAKLTNELELALSRVVGSSNIINSEFLHHETSTAISYYFIYPRNTSETTRRDVIVCKICSR